MINTAPVSFGQALLDDEHLSLRETIVKLAAGRLTQPLRVDTVLGRYSEPANDYPAKAQMWLLFDFHRLFLYDDRGLPDAPNIDSIVQFIIDDYPFKEFDSLSDYLKRHPFKFFYDLETLDLLPLLWSSVQPGNVTVLDLVSAEIRVSKVHVHPHVQTTSDRVCDSAKDLFAGSGWRTNVVPNLEGLRSPDVGFIRGERNLMSRASVPVGIARVAWKEGRQEAFCGGISFHGVEATLVARCEGLERLHIIASRVNESLIHGSYAELSDVAVDPASLFFSASGPRRGQPLVDYDPNIPMYWTWAYQPLLRKNRLVPAQDIWFNTYMLPGEHRCVFTSTNGCALGSNFEEASLFALLEAIERDAHLTTWYLRRPCPQIDPASVTFEPFQLLWRRLKAAFPNFHIYLFDLRMDIAVPTIAAVAVKKKGNGPRCLYAIASRPLVERALFSALQDLSSWLTTNPETYPRERYEKFLDAPELVLLPEDHRAFYSLDETFGRLSFLGFDAPPSLSAAQINDRSPVKPQASYNLREVVEDILRHLEEQGVEVLLKDLTFPTLAKQIRCVKAVTPGLYPMWFGYNHARFAVTERLQRLARTFTGRTLVNESDFNLDIHPLS
jgi:thiazole/oxazole-forming peptide maturase SagD family component